MDVYRSVADEGSVYNVTLMKAPLLEVADIGLTADLFAVVPELIEALKLRSGQPD